MQHLDSSFTFPIFPTCSLAEKSTSLRALCVYSLVKHTECTVQKHATDVSSAGCRLPFVSLVFVQSLQLNVWTLATELLTDPVVRNFTLGWSWTVNFQTHAHMLWCVIVCWDNCGREVCFSATVAHHQLCLTKLLGCQQSLVSSLLASHSESH